MIKDKEVFVNNKNANLLFFFFLSFLLVITKIKKERKKWYADNKGQMYLITNMFYF